ncbi:hypothetical protein [Oceanobacter mangrovi]|uniref:hypothetical protein n=1 Tax=Oceanobacter mangrovi TaxID=2862510 RepID=UPI001C8E6C89|nr:hypothetical protein [Oceanobacter mangrovi]
MTDFIPATTATDEDANLAASRDAINAMYKAAQTKEAAKELAHVLKYGGNLAPDVLEDGIRESQARIGAEIFQIGARLLLIKEQAEHGQFLECLQRLDINPRAAQKFMQVSLKFSNAPISAHLAKVGKSKILELLVLDDEEIEELAEEGSVRGLELDDIDRMPVSELRKKLREEKNKSEAAERLNTVKSETIDSLLTELDRKPQTLPKPDEDLAKLHGRVAEISEIISKAITGSLNGHMTAIANHHDQHGGSSDQILLGHLNQISNEIAELRELFALAEVVDGVPEWERWNDNQLNMLDQLDDDASVGEQG